MTATLYVAARAPRPGFTKTRLGHAIGHERAALLYAAFIRDLAARFAGAPFPVGWYVTPADAWDDLGPLTRPANGRAQESVNDHAQTPRPTSSPLPTHPSPLATPHSPLTTHHSPLPTGPVLVQGPGDWAARQQALFLDAPARGETRTVLIASDSPHLDVAVVTEAFALLERHDLVLGPVDDGGYYLIGMRGAWDVLGGVRMSTGTVLAEIIARAERQGLTVGFVRPTFDVDEVEDLARLAALAAERDDLPSTRAALATLGWLAPCSDVAPALLCPWPSVDGVASRAVP